MAGQINAEGTTLGARIRKYVQVRVLLLLRQDGGRRHAGYVSSLFVICHATLLGRMRTRLHWLF